MSDHPSTGRAWLLRSRQVAAIVVEAMMTVVATVVIGPPLAAAVFVVWKAAPYALDRNGSDMAVAAFSLPLMMTASYVFGFLPAILCGVSAAVMNLVVRTGWLRLVAAPLLGLATIRTFVGWESAQRLPGGVASQVAFAVGAFGSVLVVQMARSRPASRGKRR